MSLRFSRSFGASRIWAATALLLIAACDRQAGQTVAPAPKPMDVPRAAASDGYQGPRTDCAGANCYEAARAQGHREGMAMERNAETRAPADARSSGADAAPDMDASRTEHVMEHDLPAAPAASANAQ